MSSVLDYPIAANSQEGTLSPSKVPSQRRLAVDFAETNTLADKLSASDGARILEAAVNILTQGEELLRTLSLTHYTERVPLAFNGSIGGHYRHCLDHFTSLLRGLASDEVDYDRRERDARIETDPAFACHLTQHLRESLEQLTPDQLLRPVNTRCEVSYLHGHSPLTSSTYGRELVYAIAHAIHHYALIAVMARLLAVPLPPHFGVAPSTVAHQSTGKAH
jgi:uncharacterized damage-inducible protein DinB